MDEYLKVFFGSVGTLSLLILFLLTLFLIWLIKKGVKNAIKETLYSMEFREQLRDDITFSIIRANREINKDTNFERPTD